ncbi:MAG: hypothetical protein AAGH46_07510, partial [Bacteroidota bacterium]
MKNLGKYFTTLKLFKKLNTEERKLLIFAPAAVIITACVLYFGLSTNNTVGAQETSNDIDLLLPNAKTKQLSNEKQEVFEDLENYNSEIRLDKESDFETVLDDPLGANSSEDQKEAQLMTVEEQIKIIEKKQEPIYQNNQSYNNQRQTTKPLTKQEREEQYREDLLKAREARLARSQDYSIPT